MLTIRFTGDIQARGIMRDNLGLFMFVRIGSQPSRERGRSLAAVRSQAGAWERVLRVAATWVLLTTAIAAAANAQENFKPLFNGKDLSGWVIVNVAPNTFTARDGMIVSTGK